MCRPYNWLRFRTFPSGSSNSISVVVEVKSLIPLGRLHLSLLTPASSVLYFTALCVAFKKIAHVFCELPPHFLYGFPVVGSPYVAWMVLLLLLMVPMAPVLL